MRFGVRTVAKKVLAQTTLTKGQETIIIAGSIAGKAIGQAVIPLPVVGGMVGGIVGSVIGLAIGGLAVS